MRKEEGSYVGLQNLGATCYVNTFLQLWYHMPPFRAAVYSWQTEKTQPMAGIQETSLLSTESNLSLETNEQQAEPSTLVSVDEASSSSAAVPFPEFESGQFPGCFDVCGQLQLIFTQLHYSSRRFISPSTFVSVLGLSKDEQQDAQEFCKLFLSLLESQLAAQPSCLSRNAVQDLFGGRYSYVTTCSVCQTESTSPSEFLELDLNIQDKANLQECIQDFLQVERLEGDDQYYCSQCMTKQNATRQIAIESLPPVLNMQLLRFVFDRATFRKKKLNSYLQFPEELDMAPFLSKETSESILQPGQGLDCPSRWLRLHVCLVI
jgi:ubiquitin carboxyl-terminal hydrolase 48